MSSSWIDLLRTPRYSLPVALLVVSLAYIGIEAAVSGADAIGPRWLFQWRLFPALLWVVVAPILVHEGARWSGWTRDRGRVLAWAVGFLGLHAAVNVIIRLPDGSSRGVRWLVADAVEGAVHYAPAALLLYTLLIAAGYQMSGGGARSREGGVRPGGGSGPNGGNGGSPVHGPEPLTLHGGDRTHVVSPGAIRWLEAEGDYVRVHAVDRSFLVRGPMKSLERRLSDAGRFVRIHRSTLVGLLYVREVRPLRHGDYVAVLDDGTELRVPRTRRQALKRLRNGD